MDHTTADFIAENICPVCEVARRGMCPRRALQEHLRRSKRADHILWCENNYSKYFTQGGDRTNNNVTTEDIKQALKKAYGSDWSERLDLQPRLFRTLDTLAPIQT